MHLRARLRTCAARCACIRSLLTTRLAVRPSTGLLRAHNHERISPPARSGRIMPINKRVGSAQEAIADVRDGATVMISGFGGAGFPNTLIRALRDRAPKDM